MAPDADATAGPPPGWHDLEAVLAEEPVATLLAAYLEAVFRIVPRRGLQPGICRRPEAGTARRSRADRSAARGACSRAPRHCCARPASAACRALIRAADRACECAAWRRTDDRGRGGARRCNPCRRRPCGCGP